MEQRGLTEAHLQRHEPGEIAKPIHPVPVIDGS